MSEPFWGAAVERPERPPERADVVVVGAGVAGGVAAILLARAGCAVVVLDARGPGGGATGRSAGFLLRGTADHPERVAAQLGATRAVAMFRYTAESLDELLALIAEESIVCGLRRPGSLVLAVDDEEARSLEASLALVSSLPHAGELWDAATVTRRTGGRGFTGGWLRPLDGVLDPARLATGLAAAATRHGARIVTGVRVETVDETRDAALVRTSAGTVRAARVLYAVNAALPALQPRLADTLVPVRAQMLATAPSPEPRRLLWPVYAHHGYEYWRQEPSGEVLFGGCRWAAAPGLERGVTDDATVSEPVFEAQRAFITRHLPDFASLPVTRRWSGIMAFTPDALPLVGRIPGHARSVVCAGWTGHGLALAPRSARIAVDLLLDRPAKVDTPLDFSPGRFA